LPLELPLNQKKTLNLIVVAAGGRRSAVYSAAFLRRGYLDAMAEAAREPGLQYALFEGTFTSARALGESTPASSGVTDSLELQQFNRTSNYGVRFKGILSVPSDSYYQFAVESDDGSVLEIDDEVVVVTMASSAVSAITGPRGPLLIQLRWPQAEGAPRCVAGRPLGGYSPWAGLSCSTSGAHVLIHGVGSPEMSTGTQPDRIGRGLEFTPRAAGHRVGPTAPPRQAGEAAGPNSRMRIAPRAASSYT
jgi:hypothetical protein